MSLQPVAQYHRGNPKSGHKEKRMSTFRWREDTMEEPPQDRVHMLPCESSFTETMQLGIVVRDLEATVRRYEDDYGIGRWRFDRIDLGATNDYREYGEPFERSNRIAIATVGLVMWELIEPLDEDGIYARFLTEKGEGVHHVAVATPDFDETVARAEGEDGVMLSCKHSGIDIAYLDTLRDLGVIIEIASGMPGDGELPDANRTS